MTLIKAADQLPNGDSTIVAANPPNELAVSCFANCEEGNVPDNIVPSSEEAELTMASENQ